MPFDGLICGEELGSEREKGSRRARIEHGNAQTLRHTALGTGKTYPHSPSVSCGKGVENLWTKSPGGLQKPKYMLLANESHEQTIGV
jgi:hypothetical protein